MRKTVSVLSSLFLSLLVFNGPQVTHPESARERVIAEPGGPLSAGATLVALRDTAEGRKALMRVSMTANTADTEVALFALDPDRGTARGPAVASASLRKGQPRDVLVEADAQRGQETHVFFRVKGRGGDGSDSELTVYYRVPPGDSEECQTVGEYVECAGVSATEVQP